MRVFGCIAGGVLLLVALWVATLVFLSVAGTVTAIVIPSMQQHQVVASQSASQSMMLNGSQAERVYVTPVASQRSSVHLVPTFPFILLIVLLVAIVLIALRRRRRVPHTESVERSLLETMYDGLSGMEKRLESLETIILERRS